MQTFLPYPSFSQSAYCLDNRRLNKQITETLQIYKALTVPGYGWQYHPAVKMWRGCERALLWYGHACYAQWKHRYMRRQRSGVLEHKSGDEIDLRILDVETIVYPPWLGDEAFHASHRAALLYKLPEWYSRFGWIETPAVPDKKGRLPYVWPKGKE